MAPRTSNRTRAVVNPLKPMKPFSTACQLISAGIICICGPNVLAQSLFSDSFNYAPGSTLGGSTNVGNNTAWSGGNAVLSISSSQLSYPGLQQAAGNDLVYTSGVSASTTYNTFAAVNSGSVYYSFLIDCTTLPTANNYLTALNASPTTPGGSSDQLSTYAGASGTGWKLGVRTSGGGSGAAYSGTLALNTTYFIVEELTFGSPSVANLYVDPVPGGAQPGTATATQSTATVLAGISDVGFKAQSTASTGDFDFGSLLIAQDWADVTPAAVPEPNTVALLGGGLVLLQAAWRRRHSHRS